MDTIGNFFSPGVKLNSTSTTNPFVPAFTMTTDENRVPCMANAIHSTLFGTYPSRRVLTAGKRFPRYRNKLANDFNTIVEPERVRVMNAVLTRLRLSHLFYNDFLSSEPDNGYAYAMDVLRTIQANPGRLDALLCTLCNCAPNFLKSSARHPSAYIILYTMWALVMPHLLKTKASKSSASLSDCFREIMQTTYSDANNILIDFTRRLDKLTRVIEANGQCAAEIARTRSISRNLERLIEEKTRELTERQCIVVVDDEEQDKNKQSVKENNNIDKHN